MKLLGRCRDKPFRYSRPLHEHRVVSLRQQVEHSLQISDPVRHTDQVRMQAYRQNARLAFYFAVEYRYRVSQPLKHLRRGMFLDGVDDAVVDFQIVGHGDERAVFGAQPVGEIVNHPVAHILDAALLEDVRRLVGCTQSRGYGPDSSNPILNPKRSIHWVCNL